MKCPLESESTADLLLEYSAGRLASSATAQLEQHMLACARCAAFRVDQTELWETLNLWEPQPVSTSFNRELWKKIDAAAAAPWYKKLADAFRFGSWKPAFPLAAAVVVIAAGFVFDHPGTRSFGTGAHSNASVQIGGTLIEADQVEKTLDDLQLLRQFDAAAGETATSRPM